MTEYPEGEPYVPPPPTGPPPAPQWGQPPQYGQPPYQPYPNQPYPQYPPPYPYPPVPYPASYGPPRPGGVVGSAVLAFIVAGLLILLGLLLILGGSITGGIEDAADSGTAVGTELVIDGLLNLVASGLLIGGGVSLLNGRRSGRAMQGSGNAIVVGLSIYWLTRFGGPGPAAVWPLMFAALAIISLALAYPGDVSRWLSPRR